MYICVLRSYYAPLIYREEVCRTNYRNCLSILNHWKHFIPHSRLDIILISNRKMRRIYHLFILFSQWEMRSCCLKNIYIFTKTILQLSNKDINARRIINKNTMLQCLIFNIIQQLLVFHSMDVICFLYPFIWTWDIRIDQKLYLCSHHGWNLVSIYYLSSAIVGLSVSAILEQWER